MEIKKLSPAQLREAYPLVHQIRPSLSEEKFIEITTEMISNGYQILCLYKNEKILAYAGFAEHLNLYHGKHIWLYELVVDENHRSKGYGKMLLSHIESHAKEKNLKYISLCSALEREDAHRFYEKNFFKKTSFVFKKDVPND